MTGVFGRDRINSNLGATGAHGSSSLAEVTAKLAQAAKQLGDGLKAVVIVVLRSWLRPLVTSAALWSRVSQVYCAYVRAGIGLSGDRREASLSGRTAASPAPTRLMSRNAFAVLSMTLRGLTNWLRGVTRGRRGTC